MKIYTKNDTYTLIYKSGVYRGECFRINPFERIAHGKSDANSIPLYGKRINLSTLPDEAKEYALQFLHLPNFRLPKLSTRYGAPMGRSNTAKGKCKLGRVSIHDGYDLGGAYWGIGERLYVAKSKTSLACVSECKTHPGFSFTRAKSAFEAIKEFESMGLTF